MPIPIPLLFLLQFVAQFAGLSTYTFNTFAENNFAVNENCVAQAFLVAGMYGCSGGKYTCMQDGTQDVQHLYGEDLPF